MREPTPSSPAARYSAGRTTGRRSMRCESNCSPLRRQARSPEMAAPLYQIPGQASAPTNAAPANAAPANAADGAGGGARTVSEVLARTHTGAVIGELEADLVGLAPVKSRIRDIAALLVIDRLRMNLGLPSHAPTLHMAFTGKPGRPKTTVPLRMAEILHRFGYVNK